MEQQRTVTLLVDAEIMARTEQEVGYDALMKAIGYLSTWNLSYPNVTIWIDDPKDVEIQASYRDAEDKQK